MAELFGEEFDLLEPSEFDVMEFAEKAQAEGVTGLGQLAALMNLLRSVVPVQEWSRFRATCKQNRAKVDDLLPFFMGATGQVPSSAPSVSTDGRSATPSASVSGSVSRARQSLPDGRPDLHLLVRNAEQARSA